MKKILYIVFIIFGVAFNACEDVLEKPPMDVISDPAFWTSEADLELFLNQFYDGFSGWGGLSGGWSRIPDNGTDILIHVQPSTRMDGIDRVPESGGDWDWRGVRRANYFIDNMDRVDADSDLKDQYVGEGHFFRALFYFELFRTYGDLPIITIPLNIDDEELYAARSPRTEVANFIISDLDEAISKLKEKGTAEANRVTKGIALLLKARFCLYAGTWEKYHQGTDFAGSTDGTGFIQQAAAAAKAVIEDGNYALKTGNPSNVYYNLFNQDVHNNNDEVMLYRQYDYLNLSIGNILQYAWPNYQGMTRSMARSYLCTDGDPIGVSPLYQGDESLNDLTVSRDPRCAQSIMVPGDVHTIYTNGDIYYYEHPTVKGSNVCPTAYELQKYRNPQIYAANGYPSLQTSKIIYRYAEVLLIYAEAQAELGVLTQGDLDISINQLRDRVSMPHLTLGAIASDPEWPDYGYSIPDYLYEIRRERVVEMSAEGLRMSDLMRWRAHGLFVGKRPKGAFYEDLIMDENAGLPADGDNYLDPFVNQLTGPNGGYGFNPERDYLVAIPTEELALNENLTQNPGW